MEELSVDTGFFLEQQLAVRQIGPITRLKLWNTSPDQLMTLIRTADFTNLSALNLQHNQLGDTAVQDFLQSIDCSQITMLNLTGNQLTRATAELIGRLNWPRLQRIVLSQNPVDLQVLLSLHELLGDCVQHENGDPVLQWAEDTVKEVEDPESQWVSYDDDLLYEDGHIHNEREFTAIDRFHGTEELDDEVFPQRPDDYELFDDGPRFHAYQSDDDEESADDDEEY